MSAEIIDIEQLRPVWVGGAGFCGLCGVVWPCVAHMTRLWGLECPGCGEMSGLILKDVVFIRDALAGWLDEARVLDLEGDAIQTDKEGRT